jgi:hypothetical protein
MARLPTQGGDDGNWGSVLNDFLQVGHGPDGKHQYQFFNVKEYGAIGDGTTDDTAAITNAINAANTPSGGVVFFPAGTYITGPQTIYSNITYLGSGVGASIIQLKPGSNAALFKADQFDANTGTTNTGISKFAFRQLTLDGNKAGQTAKSLGLQIYGYNYVVDSVWIQNCYGGGVYSEWNGPANPMEAYWSNFKIWNWSQPGSIGLDWNGPHDSVFSNGIVATLDSSITVGGTTAYGIRLLGVIDSGHAGGEVFTNVHEWGRAHYGWYTSSQIFCSNCQGEGGIIANVVFDAPGCVWMGGTIYGTNGNSGTQPNEVGLQIGLSHVVSRCLVSTFIYNFATTGLPVKMVNTAGDNVIRVVGAGSSLNAMIGGSPFYNAGGDWYEIICKTNHALSVFSVPVLPRFVNGVWLGDTAGVAGSLFSGPGVPSNTLGVDGDYYFRTGTPSTAAQRVYIKVSGVWTDALGGGGSTSLAGDTDVAIAGPVNNQVLTYDGSISKWKNATPASSAGYAGTLESAVALGANAVFTGQPHDATSKSLVMIAAEADQTYTLAVQQSNDASAWTTTFTTTPLLNSGAYIVSQILPLHRYNYFRVVLTNGATIQTYLTLSSCIMGIS